MNETVQQIEDEEKKLAWVEPRVAQLDVSETASIAGGEGTDGGTNYDCTHS